MKGIRLLCWLCALTVLAAGLASGPRAEGTVRTATASAPRPEPEAAPAPRSEAASTKPPVAQAPAPKSEDAPKQPPVAQAPAPRNEDAPKQPPVAQAAPAKAEAAPAAAEAVPAPGRPDAAQGQIPTKPNPVVEKGMLRNAAHGFRFPVPPGWNMQADSTPDEMVFTVPACEECVLRVLVFPDGDVPLEETVKAIREHIEADASARVIGEEPIQVAHKDGHTLLKEETLAGPSGKESSPPSERAGAAVQKLKTRYVTFNYQGDRYYLLLRAPGQRFAADDAAFETLLAKFRFGN